MGTKFANGIPQLAAVGYDSGVDATAFLRGTVSLLRERNIKVGCIAQRLGMPLTASRRAMLVEDLLTGRSLQISQDLGPQARGCVLNSAALAAATEFIRRAIDNRVNVLVGNRFGERETDSRGLRSELAEAAARGIIVLTAVKACHVDAWNDFGGQYTAILEPKFQVVCDWIMDTVDANAAYRQLPGGNNEIAFEGEVTAVQPPFTAVQ